MKNGDSSQYHAENHRDLGNLLRIWNSQCHKPAAMQRPRSLRPTDPSLTTLVSEENNCQSNVSCYPKTPTAANLNDSHIISAEKSGSLRYDKPMRRKMYSLSVLKRASSLFIIGAAFAFVFNFLQRHKAVTKFAPGVFGDVLNSAWWIPPVFGFGSVIIGLLYPCVDQILGNPQKFKNEWSSVMRCVAIFIGINHASARINFDSDMQLCLVLAILSIGLWWLFDQTPAGLGLGLVMTSVATLVTQVLVALDVFGYTSPDFLYIQSWVPCLYFSGGITIGTIGRALAMEEEIPITKQHLD